MVNLPALTYPATPSGLGCWATDTSGTRPLKVALLQFKGRARPDNLDDRSRRRGGAVREVNVCARAFEQSFGDKKPEAKAGVAFVAANGDAAFLHALEVRPALRRQGTAVNILKMAAKWAISQGAGQLALAVTLANGPANHLYASLGMAVVGRYHYRQK